MAAPRKRQKKKSGGASAAVARQLARYRSMRDFGVTAEPRGESKSAARPPKSAGLPFVIQKHAATRLHYDFRLGWRGVLKSWAVTKGPSYFPGDKRLAVQVEDHPIEYGGFEGTIPKGQYGGGTVMVWDQGEWTPHGDVDDGLERGSLKFTLRGEKLKGDWALVRMHGDAAGEKKANWLLIKERDEFAQSSDQPAITDESPDSVVTNRNLEEIAANNDHVWDSGPKRRSDTAEPSGKPRKEASPSAAAFEDSIAGSLPKEELPEFVSPQLAMTAKQPPTGEEWIHELKLDGYRIQARLSVKKAGFEVQLLTRNGLDWTHRMQEVASAMRKLPVESAILDGEVVVLDERGVSSFAGLQAAFQEGKREPLTYFAFDLLHLNGRNTRGMPLNERKRLLAGLLNDSDQMGVLRLGEHVLGHGDEVFAKACSLGAEGIVSKELTSKYDSGRARTWLKSKCVHEQEFVIGGFTHPSKGGDGLGALLLGYYKDGKLHYAGRCGTGFTQKSQRILRRQLEDLAQEKSSFSAPPAEAKRGARWVKPDLVAQVGFATWTSDGLLRQASFKGLREDKAAKEVAREEPSEGLAEQPEHATVNARRQAERNRRREGAPAHDSGPDKKLPIKLTNPGKILDQESGLSKEMLAVYYLTVAPVMLPHISGRPLSLVRCPEGSGKPCFFQKHSGPGLPAGLDRVPVPDRKTGVKEDYVTVSTEQGLAGLAQMGVLEVHPWGSRNDSLEMPDRLIFDLDPDASIAWPVLAETARKVRALLKKLGLESFVKSTGGKGLHVVVPIKPEREWPAVKAFCHSLVLGLERKEPSLYLTKMTKAARKDKIYLDYLRNDRGATSVGPFSPRARPGAPVAIPLSWRELSDAKKPEFRVVDLQEWKGRLKKDPWDAMPEVSQSLTEGAIAAAGDEAASKRGRG